MAEPRGSTAWTEEKKTGRDVEGHLRRDAAALDDLLGGWRQDLELGELAHAGVQIRERVQAKQRPASARPASAAARKGDAAGAAPQRRRPRSAHPAGSKGMIALQPRPGSARAQLAPQQQPSTTPQPTLRIPEEFLELLKNRAIRKVSLGAQGLRPTDAEVLANFLARDRVVTELVLPRNRIGCEGLAHLARAMAGTPVELLDLSDNDICHSGWPSQAHMFSAEALEELVDSLPESAVTDLDLSHNCLTGKDPSAASLQGVHAVARGLAAPAGCPLRRLTLAHNRLGDEGAELLGLALARRSDRLRTLDLSYCALSAPNGSRAARATGLIQIFKSLASNHALRALDLTGNSIGSSADEMLTGAPQGAICGRGVETLAGCFADSTMPALTELILADNGFTYGEECKLALSLINNRSLEMLDMSPGPHDADQSGDCVLVPREDTQMGVHYVELLSQRDPGGGGKSSPLHWSCRQRSATCVAIMLWRHPKLLLEMDGYGDTPLDVARTVFDPACIELLERAYQQRISYRGRWVSSGEVVRPDEQQLCEYAMDGESGKRVMLRFFTTEERSRWTYERDMLRAVAPGEDGAAGDRFIAGLVDSFFDDSREEAGLPPLCLVLEAGESTLGEVYTIRRERQAHAEQARFGEYGRVDHQLTAPSSMKAHAASLAFTIFTPSEVKFLARHLAESLFHLHSTCRVSHAAVSAHTIMRFGDGTWRTIDHFHSKPFGTMVNAAVCGPSCPPELAECVLGGNLLGVQMTASYDLWGMGALMFELLTGRPLIATADTPFSTEAEQYDVYARLAALDATALRSRLITIGDGAARDFVGLLLGLGEHTFGEFTRTGADTLLGRGGGRTTQHKFLCENAAEYGWLSDQAIDPGNGDDDLTWVSVPRISTVADASARGGSITTFEVVVNLPRQPVRSVNRRYAEFKWLLGELQNVCTAPEGGRRSKAFFGWEAGDLEPTFVGPLSPAAAERRRLGLQRFIQTASDISDECAPVVLAWLGPVATGRETEATIEAAEAEAAAAAKKAAAEAIPKDLRLGQYNGSFHGVEQPFAPEAEHPGLTVDDPFGKQSAKSMAMIREHTSPHKTQYHPSARTYDVSVSSIAPEWDDSGIAGAGEETVPLSQAEAATYAAMAGMDSMVRPLAETATAVSSLQTQISTLVEKMQRDTTASKNMAVAKPSVIAQQLVSMVHAQTAIAEVLDAQSRRHAADAALPGLQRGDHSAEAEEGDRALEALHKQMDFIGQELVMAQAVADAEKGKDSVVIVMVTWRRLDGLLCRLMWMSCGLIGGHWLPVARHLHRRASRRQAAAVYQAEQRRNAGKYDEPLEPPSEDDGERGLPWLTRTFLYWMYVGIIFALQSAMTGGGMCAFKDCVNTVNTDCVGSFAACTSACEPAGAHVWTELAAQSGTGAACPPVLSCQPGEEACPQNVDCAGSFSACTSACEAAGARVWYQTAPRGGTGAVCPPAASCKTGRDACLAAVSNVDCSGQWSACTTACETAGGRIWAESVPQSGSGAACPLPSVCQPGDDACPANTDCAGSFAACTSTCEAGGARIWTESVAQSGTGAACPSALPCQRGEGSCPLHTNSATLESPIMLGMACLYQQQSNEFIGAYVLQWFIAASLVTTWVVDGLWLIPLNKQLRQGQSIRLALPVTGSPEAAPIWSYVVAIALAFFIVSCATLYGVATWAG